LKISQEFFFYQITLTQCGAIISNIIGSLLTLLGVYMEGQICQKKIMWQIFDTKTRLVYGHWLIVYCKVDLYSVSFKVTQ
jgi:hypothetical protein